MIVEDSESYEGHIIVSVMMRVERFDPVDITIDLVQPEVSQSARWKACAISLRNLLEMDSRIIPEQVITSDCVEKNNIYWGIVKKQRYFFIYRTESSI